MSNTARTLVINVSHFSKMVATMYKGEKGAVQIMARSRAYLQAGTTVTPNYIAVNGKDVKVYLPLSKTPATVADLVAESTKPVALNVR